MNQNQVASKIKGSKYEARVRRQLEGMSNSIRVSGDEWHKLADEALEAALENKRRAVYWQRWAHIGFAYAAADVAWRIWSMFR